MNTAILLFLIWATLVAFILAFLAGAKRNDEKENDE